MKVFIKNKQRALALSHERKKICQLVHFVLEEENRSCDEVGIFFITDAAMRKLHKTYFNDDSSTDCITFPLDDAPSAGSTYLGDLFVCPEVALSHKNPYKEVTLYIVHCLLHLLGYDDIDKALRRCMIARQTSLMKKLERKGLVLHA